MFAQAGKVATEEGGAGAPAVEKDEGWACGRAGRERVKSVSGAWEMNGTLSIRGFCEMREEGSFCGMDGRDWRGVRRVCRG